MRKLVILILIFGLVGFVSAVIPGDCIDSEGMVAYWRMEGNLDDSFNGYDSGSWSGSASYADVGVGLNASVFDGSNYVLISGGSGIDFDNSFSIELLMNSDSSSGGILFEKGGVVVRWVDGGDGASSVVADIGSVSVSSSGNLDYNTNYHIVLVWVSVPGNLILYVNGGEKGTTPMSSPVSDVGGIVIGEDFSGWIDEVAVYNSALDESSIETHNTLLGVDKDYCDPSGFGGSSSTGVDFFIPGCEIPGTEDSVTRGHCSVNGEYFCDSDDELFVTRDDCSQDSSCCPSGFYCNETSSTCTQSTEQCSEQGDETSCENIGGCVWDSEEGICFFAGDYSCSVYKTEERCGDDIWNLGQEGVGTEVCGSYVEVEGIGYVISYDSCACDWDASDSSCKLGYDIYPDIYGSDVDSFRCLKSFDMGDCVDGEQDYSWTVSDVDGTGALDRDGGSFDNNLFSDIAVAAGCDVGSGTRNCGEPVVRLPGFGLFAFFVSVFLIGLAYAVGYIRN